MKWIKTAIGAVMLVMSICFIIPLKVSAETPDGYAEDWYNYIIQFDDGVATATIHSKQVGDWVSILIKQSPDNVFNGYYIQYDYFYELTPYFEEDLRQAIMGWVLFGFGQSFDTFAETYFGNKGKEYIGIIYWNFEEEYWQIEPYGISELEYYQQKNEYLENKIQQLEDALPLEYERGYNEGYDDGLADGASGGDYQEGYQTGYDEGYQTGYNEGILACDYQEGYQEGYQDGFIAGEKSKIAKNNETFYKNIAIWIPAAISLIALASIISIFGIKRKNE